MLKNWIMCTKWILVCSFLGSWHFDFCSILRKCQSLRLNVTKVETIETKHKNIKKPSAYEKLCKCGKILIFSDLYINSKKIDIWPDMYVTYSFMCEYFDVIWNFFHIVWNYWKIKGHFYVLWLHKSQLSLLLLRGEVIN